MRRGWLLVPVAALLILTAATLAGMSGGSGDLSRIASQAERTAITDRNGVPLGISYQNRWNSFDYTPLHKMPDFLLQAIVASEDHRFYRHHGVDLHALAGAAWQDLKSGARVRGASTITEQVVRILHPRPRSLWSKWLEFWDAIALESRTGKGEILEFYCNEVPYAANRRGVVQAASYYFNRDLSTLNRKEMLALVVLARAPSGYDLYRHPTRIEPPIQRLAEMLRNDGRIDDAGLAEIATARLTLESADWEADAPHFLAYLRSHVALEDGAKALRSTLDVRLQRRVHDILAERLKDLGKLSVHNAAALVVDHRTAEVLAWVVIGNGTDPDNPDGDIDAVVSPRQPGSAMKPFLYAMALDKGWTPATIIEDSPMAEQIGSGLHEFRNYSRSFYGKVTLREALGNSLNIPALRTIGYVGFESYLDRLHDLGFASLNRDAAIYREGLALGNGEVTLFEMAQGYAALANRGEFRPLSLVLQPGPLPEKKRIFSPEAASLIGNILSDSWARAKEFGASSVLNLPVQTAVKTGTSTDYHDAWTMGFDSRYVVGIWMGNLTRDSTDGVTGAVGPALALHSVFAELQRDGDTAPLYLSPNLVRRDVCIKTEEGTACAPRSELFLPGNQLAEAPSAEAPIQLSRPTQGLQMAFDPRIPADRQIFTFRIDGMDGKCPTPCTVSWRLNDQALPETAAGAYDWRVARGSYDLRAEVKRDGVTLFASGAIRFVVK